MIVDANLLLYATNKSSPFYVEAAAWWKKLLNSQTRVGLPQQTILAYLRLSTHPKVQQYPDSPAEAVAMVSNWVGRRNVWIPEMTTSTIQNLAEIAEHVDVGGNKANDAMLAALAITHGVRVATHDTDFARFEPLGCVAVYPLR